MILELVKRNDPILKKVAEKFDFNNPPVDPLDLATDLAETLLETDAVAIAANQVGLPHRVFVIKAEELIVCFNPVIVDQSEETIKLDEACLTFKGVSAKIKRPRVIKVRYTEPNGKTVTKVFQDMTARIFQHEIDHLNGLTMVDRCSYIEKDKLLKKLK